MKRLIHIIIFLSLGLSSLTAQDRLSDRIENNLKQLGRKIIQIRLLAERYENNEALKTIESAKEDFDEAISLLQQWKDSRHRLELLEQARAKYQSANLKADLASRMLLFKPAANLMNQLERLIQQAETVAQGSDASDLRYYLNKARNYYKHAQNAFAGNRYLRGHEYLKIATYFAEKVISLAKGNRPADQGQRFEELKNNITVLLNRVSNLLDENDILNELYNNVLEYLKRAENAYASGNLKRAFANLQIAERLTHRIIDLAEEDDQNSSKDHIEEEYQSLSRYLTTLHNEFEMENQQSKILDKADEFHSKARMNIDHGEYQQALTNLKLAQRMAMRAFKDISSQDNSSNTINLQNRIREIQHLINLQQARIDEQQNKAAKTLFEQAGTFFRQGQQEYENANYIKASYLFNITLRILNNNEKILKGAGNNSISEESVLKELNQADQLINRLKSNASLDENNQSKIAILEKLLDRARQAFENKDYFIAKEIIAIIQSQLTNLLND
jgi:hypothetical protein